MKQFDDNEDTQSDTVWVNNTTHTAKFKIMLEKAGRAPNSAAFRAITLSPGQSIKLDSVHDHSIRTEDAYGKVVGGLCPWLSKDGEDEVEMEPCLDFEAVANQLELEKLAVKVQKDKALEEAIKIQAEQKASGVDTVKNKGGRPRKSV